MRGGSLPVTIAIVALGVVVGVALLAFTYVGLTRSHVSADHRERGHVSTVLLALAFAAGLTTSIVDGPVLRGRPALAAIVAGVVLFAVGVALRIAARRALGAAFSATLSVAAEQPLVTTGPYGFVRHPAYLGSILLSVGIAISLGSALGATAMLVLCTAAMVVRIRREERILREHFGALYDDYSRRTRRRLVPAIY